MTKLLTGAAILVLLGGGAFAFISSQNSGESAQAGAQSDVLPAEELRGSGDHIVRITDEGFDPEALRVKQGETVVWVNEGSGFYWPASNIHPTHELYSEFDPREPIGPGEAWAFTFERSGEWRCHDHLRPSRACAVTVTE